MTLDLLVLDDASSDGTGEQVAAQFPEATLLHGNGQLYWNDGMRRAFVAGSTRHPEIGELIYGFMQQMGDFDYGLHARAAGYPSWISPGTVGTCASHPRRRPGEQPLGDELRRLWSIKELSPGPWAVYSRRWAGRLWPVYWLSPMCAAGPGSPSSARRWGDPASSSWP